ncbi:MAG: alpha/beta fold hydrolase [Alphaproteobacteria bacterium]|nr:MAG: alpha/beta fold hydrolase [Alphaproteobacteria bacterium]
MHRLHPDDQPIRVLINLLALEGRDRGIIFLPGHRATGRDINSLAREGKGVVSIALAPAGTPKPFYAISVPMAAVTEPRRHTRMRLEWLMADPSVVTDDLVACRERIYEKPGFVAEMRKILCLQEEAPRRRNLMTEERLRGINRPTLVLWTTKDPTAAPEVGERIAGWLPNGRYALMQNCGHWPQYEDADTYNRLSLEFLLADQKGA